MKRGNSFFTGAYSVWQGMAVYTFPHPTDEEFVNCPICMSRKPRAGEQGFFV